MKYGVQHQSHEKKSKCERCEHKIRVESQLTVHLLVYARGTNSCNYLNQSTIRIDFSHSELFD